MPIRRHIECIIKSIRSTPYDRALAIAGTEDGTGWKMTESEAIAAIESGQYSFFILNEEAEVTVTVAGRDGQKYLKTELDEDIPKLLLSLPECFY